MAIAVGHLLYRTGVIEKPSEDTVCGLVSLDGFAFLGALVFGIIGAAGGIHMPTALYASLLGTAGGIIAFDCLAVVLHNKFPKEDKPSDTSKAYTNTPEGNFAELTRRE